MSDAVARATVGLIVGSKTRQADALHREAQELRAAVLRASERGTPATELRAQLNRLAAIDREYHAVSDVVQGHTQAHAPAASDARIAAALSTPPDELLIGAIPAAIKNRDDVVIKSLDTLQQNTTTHVKDVKTTTDNAMRKIDDLLNRVSTLQNEKDALKNELQTAKQNASVSAGAVTIKLDGNSLADQVTSLGKIIKKHFSNSEELFNTQDISKLDSVITSLETLKTLSEEHASVKESVEGNHSMMQSVNERISALEKTKLRLEEAKTKADEDAAKKVEEGESSVFNPGEMSDADQAELVQLSNRINALLQLFKDYPAFEGFSSAAVVYDDKGGVSDFDLYKEQTGKDEEGEPLAYVRLNQLNFLNAMKKELERAKEENLTISDKDLVEKNLKDAIQITNDLLGRALLDWLKQDKPYEIQPLSFNTWMALEPQPPITLQDVNRIQERVETNVGKIKYSVYSFNELILRMVGTRGLSRTKKEYYKNALNAVYPDSNIRDSITSRKTQINSIMKAINAPVRGGETVFEKDAQYSASFGLPDNEDHDNVGESVATRATVPAARVAPASVVSVDDLFADDDGWI